MGAGVAGWGRVGGSETIELQECRERSRGGMRLEFRCFLAGQFFVIDSYRHGHLRIGF